MWFLEKKDLAYILEIWNRKNQVYIPTKYYGDVILMPYEPGRLELNYINFDQPPKEFLFKAKEALFSWENDEENGLHIVQPEIEKEKVNNILFGVRSCDAHGTAYMKRFFMGEFWEDLYAKNYKQTIIVAVNCMNVGDTCFCHSLGTGPFAKEGFDLLLTPVRDGYLVESSGERGEGLLKDIMKYLKKSEDGQTEKNIVLKNTIEKFVCKMNSKDLIQELDKSFDDEIWEDLAAKCIRCGGCTNVCPTCTCFNVVEEKKSEACGKRVRYWDSCQGDSFTQNAGGHKPRTEISRVRYRIYDKLKYIEERFGHKGCSGCGRCIVACPVEIDMVRVLNTLTEKHEKQEKHAGQMETSGEPKFEVSEHRSCESVYLPQMAVIKDIIQESRSIKRFMLEYEDRSYHDNFEFSGQFFEISVFGVGEVAISIPFSKEQTGYFDFCIKKVGKVTNALHAMKVGEKVGLRGPFGKGFPLEEMKGRDILIVGSGVGVAPVRTAIMSIVEDRERYGKVVVIGSAMSYEELIYKNDFQAWQNKNMKVLYAFNKPTEVVEAHVGRINELLPNLENDWSNTSAILCASPTRIKAIAKDLISLGMDGKDIYTSLETHMRCGIGKCGHCKVGNKYMCVDGPVFTYEEMLMLPPEF